MILIQPPVVQNWNSLVNKPSILSDNQISWDEIQNKPTTLTGYGITNGQPLGNELTALQSLADTPGFLKKTGDGTYSIDINSYLSLAGGTLTGALIATSFSGVGTALTALNASNISTGTLNAARLPAAYLPLTGGTITGDLISTSATPSTSPTTGASRVTGGQGVQGNQYVGGFSSLGGDASHPAIKLIQFSGVTGASQGAVTNIAHNLTLSKIVGIQVFLRIDSSYFIPPGFTEVAGYLYTWSIYILNFNLRLSGSSSSSILSKEFEVLIFYKE
jgi:hypothetical protein